jgi:Mn-dependent DtxR family transcriptional regulator
MDKKEFHTFREDMKTFENKLTASMEDYLEMIYRLSKGRGYTRIYELSESLNVQPPSATKMVQKLSQLQLLKYEKYGIIILEDKGKKVGKKLLKRHTIIESFLMILNVKPSEILKETERIEHTISNETLKCMNDFTKFMNNNPQIISSFQQFKNKI